MTAVEWINGRQEREGEPAGLVPCCNTGFSLSGLVLVTVATTPRMQDGIGWEERCLNSNAAIANSRI